MKFLGFSSLEFENVSSRNNCVCFNEGKSIEFIWKTCNENTGGSLKKKKTRLFLMFDFTVLNFEEVERKTVILWYKITGILYFIWLKRTKIFLRLTEILIILVPSQFSPITSENSVSRIRNILYPEDLLLFSSKNLQLVAAFPMKGPINRERAWHAKNGDRGPFSLDRQFHFFSITRCGVTA